MKKIKAGDTVRLKSDPKTLYIVTKDFGEVFDIGNVKSPFSGMYEIVQKGNPTIKLDAHANDLQVELL